jgi:hypothetical protein
MVYDFVQVYLKKNIYSMLRLPTKNSTQPQLGLLIAYLCVKELKEMLRLLRQYQTHLLSI